MRLRSSPPFRADAQCRTHRGAAPIARVSAPPPLVVAVVAPLVLGLAASCLTAVLLRRGRSIAAVGAAMLAVAALPRLHLALATVNLPLDVERSSALAVSFAIAPPSLIAAPLPALADAIESTAYVLLAVGLTRAGTGRREQTATNSPH
ncbi:hypothetical protein [Salinispora arenicola]|uniref:hypothetical protein n=1 Tax=Salinispora arenicola TaxID=168697 RepID=UPI000369D242|nr:hypothetical protein [Salinispora arenicola]